MPPTKLTDSDKQNILALYRQSGETTTSLAQQFSVSTSTISRILKQSLSESEYDTLIQKKRAAGSSKPEVNDLGVLDAPAELESVAELDTPVELDSPAEEDPQPSQPDIFGAMTPAAERLDPEAEAAAGGRRQRRRSAPAAEPAAKPTAVAPPKLAKRKSVEPVEPVEEDADLTAPLAAAESMKAEAAEGAEPVIAELEEVERDILKHEGVFTDLDEDEEAEDEDDDLDDDELSADLDDDELDDDDLDDDGSLLDAAAELEDFAGSGVHSNVPLHILPLSEAKLPKSCYLVVDRTSDLVTRPLKDFAGLGLIPNDEEEERTLPVFDNHRVAKRYVRRMQRVVKVPDGQVFLKASPYLQAKGITRLLIDGRVYSL